jgi:amino acid permease
VRAPSREGGGAQVVACLAFAIVGVGILAMPTSVEGRVLVPISEGHGLSILDTVGAVLLAAAGTWLDVLLVRRLPGLRLAPRTPFGLGLLASLGLGLVLASVYSEFSGGGRSEQRRSASPCSSWHC